MTLYIVSAILGFVLIGYIIYLRIQLARKNVFIESTVRKLSGIGNRQSMDEMMELLKEIQNLSQYRSFFTDKLLEDSTLNFILENDNEQTIWLHYTREETVAKDILKGGFMFTGSFYKTAEIVTNDRLDLINKHNSRKSFGDFIVIICIAKFIVNHYTSLLEKKGISHYSFENLLSVTTPVENENSDLVYRLAAQYIKGYVNYKTGVIIKNPIHDPKYDSSAFIKNIELLKSKNKGN